MKPFFSLFGRQIPWYGVCLWAGIFLAAGVGALICKRRKMERYDLVYSAVFTMVGAIVGAKLLFLIVSLPEIVRAEIHWTMLIYGGFVFYGGLIGGILGLYIYARLYRLDFVDFLDVYAVVLPLGHAVGRVGCFLAGCCYGMEYDGALSCTYQETLGQTPINTPLFPVQLLEALCLLLLFAGLLILFLRAPGKRLRTVLVYLTGYPVIRFSLEFLRGDRERGIFLGISTSQWVSIGLLIVAAVVGVWMLRTARRRST